MDEHSDFFFFTWPMDHFVDLIPLSCEEHNKGLINSLVGGFQIVTPQKSTPEDWGEKKEKRIKRMLIERNN